MRAGMRVHAHPVAHVALSLLLLQLVRVVHGAPAALQRLHAVHDLRVELHVRRLLLAHLRARTVPARSRARARSGFHQSGSVGFACRLP